MTAPQQISFQSSRLAIAGGTANPTSSLNTVRRDSICARVSTHGGIGFKHVEAARAALNQQPIEKP